MPDEFNKMLKYNHGEKSLKSPAIIYADLECLLEKMFSCQNNSGKSYTEKNKKNNQAYAFWLFNVYKLFVWPNKKQTWLLQR